MEGPDVLTTALGLTTYADITDDDHDNNDDGSSYTTAYCYEIEAESGDSGDSGDEDDDAYAVAATMGCGSGTFATATFSSDVCNGQDFMNTTDSLDDYNKVLESITCSRIWNVNQDGRERRERELNEQERQLKDDEQERRQLEDNGGYSYGYGSAAETVLLSSSACSLKLYPYECPDPYGIKKGYNKFIEKAANKNRKRHRTWNVQKPIRFLSWMALWIGLGLACAAYIIQKRKKIASEGGGAKGLLRCMVQDSKSGLRSMTTSSKDNANNKRSKGSRNNISRERSSKRRSSKGDVELAKSSSSRDNNKGGEKSSRKSKKKQKSSSGERSEKSSSRKQTYLPPGLHSKSGRRAKEKEDDREIV